MRLIDKILLGLYKYHPVLDECLPLETGQIAWLMDNDIDDWISEKLPKKYKYPADKGQNESYLDQPLKDKAKVIKALSVLAAQNNISFVPPAAVDFILRIKLLPAGLLRAEKLDSPFGKVELFYEDNKNGIIGLLLTAFVSAIVSLITTLLSR